MRRSSLFLASVTLMTGLSVFSSALAAPASVKSGGKTYYKVNGANPNENTGKKVCALLGKACVGYTNLASNTVCKLFHPGAKSVTGVNGSKNGFFCDGAPQKGLACEKAKNTCMVCPTCNVNATCDTVITDQYREMYVECGGTLASSSSSRSSKASSRSSSSRASSSKSSSSKSSTRSSSSKSSARNSQPAYGPLPMPPAPPPVAAVTCTFNQKTKKLVTCSAVKAADTFCVTAMQSTAAKATGCAQNGNVICTLPCSAPGAKNLRTCAYGGVKTGSCTAASSASSAAAKKPAGQLCQHGGECTSGWCLGVVPGKEYRCSCNSTTYVTTCNK